MTTKPSNNGHGGRREGAGRPRNPPLPDVPLPELPPAGASTSAQERALLLAPFCFEVLANIAKNSRNARTRVSAARIILAMRRRTFPPVKQA
jgi:hypothetical protein